MSQRNGDRDTMRVGKRRWVVEGSFLALSGAGTVVASTVKGLGFGYAPLNGVMTLRPQPANNPTPLTTPGISRTGTGVYTVRFEDTYIDYEAIWCQLAGAVTGQNLYAVPVEPMTGLNTAQTGPLLTILLQTATGTPTDGATTQRISFKVVFRDSSAQYQKP